MRIRSLVIIAVVLAGAAGAFFLVWRPAIPAQAQAESFDPALVAKGRELAAVGNCIACHTVPGGEAFAGGLSIPTPFGTIHSTNITPDRETGIGGWSLAAFTRSMREGVDRAGNHLYPAFPYDHYRLVSDADNEALYAYLMTRAPVRQEAAANDLVFPLGFRPLIAGWKLLFLEAPGFTPDPSKSQEWNRGAYLAEGLGHCGGCHTPRNALGAQDPDRHFAGGEAEGWQAYAINASSPAPIPWDREALAFYLRHGWHEVHGVSRGPMAEVTGNLAGLPDSDIDAIAVYVADVMGEPSAERRQRAERLRQDVGGPERTGGDADTQTIPPDVAGMPGAALYAAACATCHESGRPLPFGGLDFRLSTAVNADSPQNIVTVTLFGLPPADGEASSVMPGFAGALDDQQVADVLAYMRARFSSGTPWADVAEMTRRTRSGEHKVVVRPSDGIERAPLNVGVEIGP
ncbi:c-type cytochrome [Ancylobacter aquaticus]|nr:c-type cytochrome [Ancylobacter aquaticus]